jgi:hypothetical protein
MDTGQISLYSLLVHCLFLFCTLSHTRTPSVCPTHGKLPVERSQSPSSIQPPKAQGDVETLGTLGTYIEDQRGPLAVQTYHGLCNLPSHRTRSCLLGWDQNQLCQSMSSLDG